MNNHDKKQPEQLYLFGETRTSSKPPQSQKAKPRARKTEPASRQLPLN